ncbi:phage baseplate assembly protein V [Chryseobacterium salipaludis]|uniref:phage baseplate assembly protein V n=1 Tax=Chryseobacterium TaxID=59732 RepID=UPI002B1CC565|nr:phage baseplate assembly protein V [Planobacterium sp. JC490]
MLKAEAQFAKVTANADPLNQGRVNVQFDWQSGQDTSEFIRVMTPDGGGSDKVNKNRGFMAIPEVGDQVMVNFIHNHPDRPFVMGGMFDGKVGAGGGQGNSVKSLSSKSGNKLELHDGEGSVFLTDKGGANMKFDGAGNAITNANNNKTVKVGNNNNIHAGGLHCTDVGEGQSVLTMGKDGIIDLKGATKVTFKVSESYIEITGTGIMIKSANITADGETTKIIGTEKATLGSYEGDPGVVVNSNVTIKGGEVDIN